MGVSQSPHRKALVRARAFQSATARFYWNFGIYFMRTDIIVTRIGKNYRLQSNSQYGNRWMWKNGLIEAGYSTAVCRPEVALEICELAAHDGVVAGAASFY
jgi:hypothetical protein